MTPVSLVQPEAAALAVVGLPEGIGHSDARVRQEHIHPCRGQA